MFGYFPLIRKCGYFLTLGLALPLVLVGFRCLHDANTSTEKYLMPISAEKTLASEHVIRAAIDIGSGATKVRIAAINLKTKKIEKILATESFTVPYQEQLLKSQSKNFDSQVMQVGIDSLKKSKEIAEKYHAQKIVAVATAAFRNANNSQEFIDRIKHETGISVFIIDQELEGKLAFEAASDHVADPLKMIVWDIGGGSLQLTMKNAAGDFQIYRGHEASVPFKNYIIKNIQNRSLEHYNTPNPMSSDDIEDATSHAREIATQVDKIFKDKIQQPDTQIVGVGNVFAYGLPPLFNREMNYTRGQLAKVVYNLAGKTDQDMGGGDFANVSISNAILILGIMQTLDMHQVTIMDINNADGAFLYSPFWTD